MTLPERAIILGIIAALLLWALEPIFWTDPAPNAADLASTHSPRRN